MPPRPPADALPPSALALCLASLALPLALGVTVPGFDGAQVAFLVWVTALVPSFVLTGHLGWRGAAWAAGVGVVVVACGAAVLAGRGADLPDWRVAAGLLAVYGGVTAGLAAGSERLDRQRRAGERQALTDPLTGLPNRRHTRIVLQVAFDAARRGVPLTVGLLDPDGFKWLNDEHGHDAGDTVLRELATLLRESLREGESVGRWSGGEFLVVLPGVDLDEALGRLDEVRGAFAALDLRWRPLTVSGGVAAWGEDVRNPDGLVARADAALIRAKGTGRDRVEAFRVDGGLTAPPRRPAAADPAAGGAPTEPRGLGGDGPLPADTAAARIVVVDDEAVNLRAFGRGLEALGFRRVATFADGASALAHIETHGADLVLLDLHMAPMDGFEVLDRLRPHLDREGFLPVVVLTGERDPAVKERALGAGGRDFLTKPVELAELRARILNLLETRALHRQVRAAASRLEDRVRERTRELEEARAEILARLARAAEYRDDATGRHQQRVGALSALLAERMGLPRSRVETLRQAAPLHDIGKIGIPDAILHKPGPLTDEEYAAMKRHALLGAELLAGSRNRILDAARVVAASHHERWDGAGYPSGLAGESIPLEGRIVAVADAFDSLTHRRSYQGPVPLEETLGRLRADAGSAFDPAVVTALDALHRAGRLADLVDAGE